jgi:uncharacterized protein (DUF1778 family)
MLPSGTYIVRAEYRGDILATTGRKRTARSRKPAKTTNITFRLTPEQKALLEEARVLSGAPDLTSFVMVPALDRARELAERESSTILNAQSRELFIELMQRPPAPSERLLQNLRVNGHEIVT